MKHTYNHPMIDADERAAPELRKLSKHTSLTADGVTGNLD
jgi:hypothetical protein